MTDDNRPAAAEELFEDEPTLPPQALNPEDDATLPPQSQGETKEEASIGDKVRYFGDYELLEEIARGGMGVVYKARQSNLNRIVALKMILAGQFAGQEDVQRFYTEAEAAAQLDHPGIVPIFEIGEHQGQHYFSMGFVDGTSLADEISDGPIDPQRAATLLRDVATAIEYAHQRGVIHRDLKPANILLDQSGQPKVTDFGLAKRIQEDSGLTGTGQILGTPAYMPPEQAAGKADQVGPLADVYSLGAVLYCLLTGRPPFQAASPMDTLLQVLQRDVVSPRALVSQVPLDLETICLKCLEKPSLRRYASADALQQELDRFLTGRPIEARPISQPQRLWRWCKRNPALAALYSMSAAVLIAFGIGGPMVASQQSRLAEQAIENQRIAEGNAYAAQMLLAQRHWEDANLVQLNATLDKYNDRPEQQNFEWNYWRRLAQSDLATFKIHEYPSKQVVFSPDGSLAASCSSRSARVWEIATGKVVQNIPHDGNAFESVAISPDGSRLATASDSGSVNIWEIASGKPILTFRGHSDGVESVVFHPDGRVIASQSPSEVKTWDSLTGTEIQTFPTELSYLNALAFTPDGKALTTITLNGTVRIVDWQSGNTRWQQNVLRQSRDNPWDIAISPDGTQLAVALSNHGVSLWDIETGKPTQTLIGHSGWVMTVAYSPDGKHLASGGYDKTVIVWDVATGQNVRRFRGHQGKLFSLAYSPDGARILSAGADSIKMWDVYQDQSSQILNDHSRSIFDLAFSQDGRFLAAVAGNTVKLWNTEIAADNGGFARPLRSFQGGTENLLAVSVSPDNRWLAFAGSDRLIRFYNLQSHRTEKTLRGHRDRINGLAFSPDGKRIASCSRDQTIKLWEVDSEKLVMTCEGHQDEINSVVFDPSGRFFASASYDQTIKIWNTQTGTVIKTLPGHDGGVIDLDINRDGSRIASAGGDATAKLWDTATGECLKTFSGHSEWVSGVAFSPDETRIATSGRDSTIRLWDVESANEVLSLNAHRDFSTCVAFDPSRNRLASSEADAGIRLWDATPWSTTKKQLERGLSYLNAAYDIHILRTSVLREIESTRMLDDSMKALVRELANTFPEPTAEAMLRQSGQVAMGQYYFPAAYEKENRRCDAVARLQHKEATLANIRALLAYRLQDYQKALELADLATINPRHAHAVHQEASLLIRSLAQWQLGNHEDARSTYQQAKKFRETEEQPQSTWDLDVELLAEEVMSLHQTGN